MQVCGTAKAEGEIGKPTFHFDTINMMSFLLNGITPRMYASVSRESGRSSNLPADQVWIKRVREQAGTVRQQEVKRLTQTIYIYIHIYILYIGLFYNPTPTKSGSLCQASRSAGTAVMSLSHEWLWTDARYLLQAAQELDKDSWSVMTVIPRQSGMSEHLAATLAPNSDYFTNLRS